MNFRKFCRDKLPAVSMTVTAWLMMLIFFRVFHSSTEQIVIISAIYFLAAALRLLWGFFRKCKFYTNLMTGTAQLDKKYLVTEMTDEPEFYEGQMVYECLREANKSMCENVAHYRHLSTEFRDYIELWVHEVKLPVASLLLMCHNNPDAGGKYAEQLRRIDDCIENVLYYSRSENAEKDYLIKEVSLKRAFANIAVRNREELQQRNVAIQTENLDVPVMTDSKWLEYMLGQLMSNSLKYLSPDRAPEISLYTEETADTITLHFRDNGIGIPASDLPYIFEKSYTGKNGRTHAKSTGMGLYIIKNLCGRLGHSVSAQSVQGEFTDIMIAFGKNDFVKMEQ